MFQNRDDSQPPGWERELVAKAVQGRFAEASRDAVFAELATWRAELSAGMGAADIGGEQWLRSMVVMQLNAIEQSGGNPAYFAEKRYMQHMDGLCMDRDQLYVLHVNVKDRQLMAKDVTCLIEMLKVRTTWFDGLSTLARKGTDASIAVPRLLELLKESDQLECCKILRTLKGIGPPARDALPAVIELADDPDNLIRWEAQAALRAIAPERAAE